MKNHVSCDDDANLAEQHRLIAQFSVEHAPEAIYWVASDSRIRYVNEQAVRSLGYAREELLSMRIVELNPECTPEIWATWWNRLKADGFVSMESVHRRKDGSDCPVWINASYYRDGPTELSFAYCRYNLAETPRDVPVFVDLVNRTIRTDFPHQSQPVGGASTPTGSELLTPRERQVMNLLIEGKSAKQIARELDIATATVARHRGRVLEKMQVNNSVELLRLVLSAAR